MGGEGTGANRRKTLLTKLMRFADLAWELGASRQDELTQKVHRFMAVRSPDEIRQLADSGELSKLMAALEKPAGFSVQIVEAPLRALSDDEYQRFLRGEAVVKRKS